MRIKEANARMADAMQMIEDVELEHRIANFLHQQQVPGSNRIKANAHIGTVVVRGQLPSRHAKWKCMGCCRRVAGVIKLIDKVKVMSNAGLLREL